MVEEIPPAVAKDEKAPKVSTSLDNVKEAFSNVPVRLKRLRAKRRKQQLEKQRKKVLVPNDAKLRRPKRPQNVLIVNPMLLKKDSQFKKIFDVLIDTFYEFSSITKVNGMYYLRRGVTSGWLRVLWSCIMIGLFTFAITLLFLLYSRYLNSPTRVIIDKTMSIEDIPFPGITVCHPQSEFLTFLQFHKKNMSC